jgi:hypothetical protein
MSILGKRLNHQIAQNLLARPDFEQKKKEIQDRFKVLIMTKPRLTVHGYYEHLRVNIAMEELAR